MGMQQDQYIVADGLACDGKCHDGHCVWSVSCAAWAAVEHLEHGLKLGDGRPILWANG